MPSLLFSFLTAERKKITKKKDCRLAFFYLLRHFSPLNKKNSFHSNSFLFFTLLKVPALHDKKKRPGYYQVKRF